MNYFRFEWVVSGFDSSGYEQVTYDRIIFLDGQEILLKSDKTFSKFQGDKGYGISPSQSEEVRGALSFEQACKKFDLNPEMPVVYGGWPEEEQPQWIVDALKKSSVPSEIKVPAYGGSRLHFLFEDEDE